MTRCLDWGVDAGYESSLPDGPGYTGGACMDQLLPFIPGACGIRWLQAVGSRPREPQDDANALSTDQEHVGQLRHKPTRFLLTQFFATFQLDVSKVV
jgi:hypothetical protein